MSTSQNFCCQCACPHGEAQPSPASGGDPPTLADPPTPHLLWGQCSFPLDPCAHKTFCVSSKSEVSVSPSPVEVLQSNPTGLQSPIFWGFLLLLLYPRLGSLTWVSEPSLQWVDFCGIVVLQFVSRPPSGYGI